MSNLSPRKIIDTIKRSSPFRIESVERDFIGINVKDWKVSLEYVRKKSGGIVRLSALAGPFYPWVYTDVKLSTYPEIKVLRKNAKFKISGTISEIRGHSITLTAAKIKFSKESKRPIGKPLINNIRNSQFYLDRVDNVKGDKIEKSEKKESFLLNPWVVGLGVTVIGGLILYYFFGIGKTSTMQDDVQPDLTKTVASISTNKPGSLRALDPLETNKDVSQVPNGVYGYAYNFQLTRFVQDATTGLTLTSQVDAYKFEVQKDNNVISIVGFVDETTFSKIGEINKTNPLSMIIFPVNWNGDKRLISIPLESITKTTYRDIDFGQYARIGILEATVSAVNNNKNIEIHRKDLN